jgi:23S rRNA-/tRNA-specific pseudouridylate synthase
LYPWGSSLAAFVDYLYANIIYQDDDIVALNKPWGVGIHLQHPEIHKKNSYLLDMESIGNPSFCLDDALGELDAKLNVRPGLKYGKTIDRFESGIVLLSKTPRGLREIKKATRRNQTDNNPFRTYWVITKGYPLIESGSETNEEVVIHQHEMDDLGEFKEPEIISRIQLAKRKLKEEEFYRRSFVNMKVLDTNKKMAVSLVEISSTIVRWQFIRCYAASKASFILGDVRFAKRVRQVLGQPIILTPGNVPGYDNYEPLPIQIRRKLKVDRNSSIPLMMHHKSIRLPLYGKRQKGEDLVVQSQTLPRHFEWTLKQLNLKPPITNNSW